MRYYQISIEQSCGQFVCGRISRAFYDYWRAREDDQLEQHVWAIHDVDKRDPVSPPMLEDGTDPASFAGVDDIARIKSAILDSNRIEVTEVVPMDAEMTHFRPRPEGYSDSFEITALDELMDGALIREIAELLVDVDDPDPKVPVFVGKQMEKGAACVAVCADEGAFDVAKLRIETWNFDGDDVAADIYYDGKPLKNRPEKTSGKMFAGYIGGLKAATGLKRPTLDYPPLPKPERAAPSAPKPAVRFSDPPPERPPAAASYEEPSSGAPSWPFVLLMPILLSLGALYYVWFQL